jgi:transposase
VTSRVRAPTSTQRDAARAGIILACAEGGSARQIANRLGVPVRRVERWRGRFLRKRLKGLGDLPRRGHAPKFGAVTRCEIIALACEPIGQKNTGTDRRGKPRYTPITRTLEHVRQDAIARGIVPTIGKTTVQRILAQGDVRPHLVRGWLHSTDPHFREKVTEICDLYLTPPPGSTVLCIDEMTGVQALEHCVRDHWGPGTPRGCPRREWEYIRHGTQAVLAAFDVRIGKVIATCSATRTGKDLLRFMRTVAAQYPEGPVHIIWDNLNIHRDGPTRRWARFNRRQGGRFVFHYTPKHASWVNQIELFFSIVHRQCLRHGDFHSVAELRAALLGFIAAWNTHRAHPFRWSFTGYPLQAEEPHARSA